MVSMMQHLHFGGVMIIPNVHSMTRGTRQKQKHGGRISEQCRLQYIIDYKAELISL